MGDWVTTPNKDPDSEIRGKRVSLGPGFSVAESKGRGAGDCSFLLALRPGAAYTAGAPRPLAGSRPPARSDCGWACSGLAAGNGAAGGNRRASLGLARRESYSELQGWRRVRELLLLPGAQSQAGSQERPRGLEVAAETFKTRQGRAPAPPRLWGSERLAPFFGTVFSLYFIREIYMFIRFLKFARYPMRKVNLGVCGS